MLISLVLMAVMMLGSVALAAGSCAHTSRHYAYNSDAHWAVCDSCGQTVSGMEAHSATCIGTCYECGAPTVAGGDHHGHYEYVDANTCKFVCDLCGYIDTSEHAASCVKSGTCRWCGGAYTGSKRVHGENRVECDANVHWNVCSDCGTTTWGPWAHYSWCDTPGDCDECGAPYSGNVVYHRSVRVEHDSGAHWSVCDLCGETVWGREAHFAWCGEPGMCDFCGETYSGSDIYHGESCIEVNDDYHWSVCEDCGEVVDGPYPHREACDSPGRCYYCGLPFQGDEPIHLNRRYATNQQSHWIMCDDCGEQLTAAEAHYAPCTNPSSTVCEACGLTFAGGNARHVPVWMYNEQTHWQQCFYCNTALSTPEAHDRSKPGEPCSVCGTAWIIIVEPARLSGNMMAGSPITASFNGWGAYAYNYWLFNDKGVIVQEHTNTTDTSWTFTVDEPGLYLLRTYATDFIVDGYADTAWFYISERGVTVSGVAVSGDLVAGATLTGTASVEKGFAFNYWLFNDQGVIVQQHTNTTDTSWKFIVNTPGVYLLRVYATDFRTEAHADSEWFRVGSVPVTVKNVTVSGERKTGSSLTGRAVISGAYAYNYWLFNDQGVIVQEHTNTTDTFWTFSVSAPGAYLLRVYATDFMTEAVADSEWFYVEGDAPTDAVVISSVVVSSTDVTAGQSVTVSANVSGGSGVYAFNYWVFNASGAIVMEKTNTVDTSATFTLNDPGAYLVRVYVTDFQTEASGDSAWIGVSAAATAADEIPVEEAPEEEPAEDIVPDVE